MKLYRIVVKEKEAPSAHHPDGRWVYLGYHPIHRNVSHAYPKRLAELVAHRLEAREPNHVFILEGDAMNSLNGEPIFNAMIALLIEWGLSSEQVRSVRITPHEITVSWLDLEATRQRKVTTETTMTWPLTESES